MTWCPALVLVALLLGVSGCGRYQEIARFPSPDGQVDAVVVEVEAGAGNPFLYQVHVVAHGAAWRKGGERLSYADPVRFRVAWADARHLELCHDDARIYPGPDRPRPGPDRPTPAPGQGPQDFVEVKLVKPAAGCATPAPRSQSKD
jgi:hypothetical protein